jgi:hypothetical protein
MKMSGRRPRGRPHTQWMTVLKYILRGEDKTGGQQMKCKNGQIQTP